ncbi:MAG: ATP-binding cassette domain-containing protein [Planctomyces sp.]|jgi:ABC-2 type transport system ATP-binding protein
MISVTQVCKTYRTGLFRRRDFRALDGVTLEVPRGVVYGLLGPNGAGKTTLIKILLGIVKRTSGDASVMGFPAGSQVARSRIGYLPENHRIPAHLTGDTALEYYGALNGLSVSEIRRRRPELLRLVGLADRGRERVSRYSKGMLQRLGIAQAVLHRPELIILDEPTDGVDPVGRREIRQVLKELADSGTTIFLNSHLLQEVELICEHIAILTSGVVRRTGTVRDLKKEYSNSAAIFQVTGAESAVRKLVETREQAVLRRVTDDAFELEVRLPSQSAQDQMIDELRAAGISIWSVGRRELTLEEAFMEIVGGQQS